MSSYPEDLWAMTDEELEEYSLSRDDDGMIVSDSGELVCAYSGRPHKVYLLGYRRRVEGGYVVDYIDKEEMRKIRPRKRGIMKLLGKLARHYVKGKAGPVLGAVI